jgi:hypothetical protein
MAEIIEKMMSDCQQKIGKIAKSLSAHKIDSTS